MTGSHWTQLQVLWCHLLSETCGPNWTDEWLSLSMHLGACHVMCQPYTELGQLIDFTVCMAVQATEDMVQSARQGNSPAVAVVGSKGVGKSTLARLLVNSLLEVSPVVAFLDTDSGQSELTVPGKHPPPTCLPVTLCHCRNA